MPKKPPRNPFYFFMQVEVIPQLRREGRFVNMEDTVRVAHPRWKVLPEREKQRYEDMAKEHKARMRGQEGDKYKMDNIGNIIANRKNPDDEIRRKKMREKQEVSQRWPAGKDLINESFYFIDFTSLCKTEEGDFLPVEIGVVEYTMKDGIKKFFHKFIEPGPIPLGYRYDCEKHSADTHQIPVERFQLADDNYRGIYLSLENFINPGGEKANYPPFFCLETKVEEVSYCLCWIHSHACLGTPNRLKKVFHLESLVQQMYEHIGMNSPSEIGIHDLVTSSVYDYERGVMCDWHEEQESKFCSLGQVKIFCYTLSDAMKSLYNFALTKKHMPIREMEPVCTVIDPVDTPRPPTLNTNNRGRGRGRGQAWATQAESHPFPARDFREKDRQQQKKVQESEQFEPAKEPQLSQSMRKPKQPGVAGQIGKVAKSQVPQAQSPQSVEPPRENTRFGQHGTLSAPTKPAVDIGQGDDPVYVERNHPVVQPEQSKSPVEIFTDEDWPSLGAAPEKPKFASRAGPPSPMQAPPPPSKWQSGRGTFNMSDIAKSLSMTQPPPGLNAAPGNLVLAGIGRGRSVSAFPMNRPPPGMSQPTVLPAKVQGK